MADLDIENAESSRPVLPGWQKLAREAASVLHIDPGRKDARFSLM